MLILKQNSDFRGVMLPSRESLLLGIREKALGRSRRLGSRSRALKPLAVVFRAVASMALALLLIACDHGSVTYRYRLTVTVDTPEGPRSGSSVIEVTTRAGSNNHAGVTSMQRGEAVAVDLGARGTLFALLSIRNDPTRAAEIAPAALMPVVDQRRTAEAALNNLRAMRDVKGAAPVPLRVYPMLVKFGDIRDPNTVMEVDPARLEASFGQGVHLRAITAEMTDDALTSTIPARFPWWNAYREKRLDGATVNIENVQDPNLAHHIGQSYFSTEG